MTGSKPANQGQSKRADALEKQAKAQGIDWQGRIGGTWTLVGRKGPQHRRTIGQMKELLDSGAHATISGYEQVVVQEKPVFVGPNAYSTEGVVREPAEHPDSDESLEAAGIGVTDLGLYVAAVGDQVLIDARTDNEIHGVVRSIADDGVVTVQATKVLIHGKEREDLVGYSFFPSQNGAAKPWGATSALEKMK